jgi:hypothetical protein
MSRPARELQIPFDRITYREGQLLASRDLQDDSQTNTRLRRMHTRFLHDTWGIALGFSIYGQVSGDSIHVGPGYALDQSAREILLSEDVELPLPSTNAIDDLMLVATYQPDSVYQNLPNLGILCAGSILDARDERPAFAWRTPDNFHPGPEIPLAHLRVQNGALITLPDLSVRRYARRMVRPHIAAGSVDALGRFILDGLTVDTSSAGFAAAPEYFVRLDFPAGGAIATLAQFAANSAFVESATPKSFVYRAEELLKFFPSSLALTLTVTWIGVEPVTGCEPASSTVYYTAQSLLGVKL